MAVLMDPLLERRELWRLKRWIRHKNLGGLITAKEQSDGVMLQAGQADGTLAFAADCVIRLSATVKERTLSRALRVVKYRGAPNPGGEFPFLLSSKGLVVGYGTRRRAARPTRERLGTGIERLDNLLDGGYLRGSSVLISGEPGTAKTILSAAYAVAAAKREERVLMVMFDESTARARSNVASVGLNLERPFRQGLVVMESMSASMVSPEAHFVQITDLIRTLNARHLIIDPISALLKSAGHCSGAASMVERLLEYARCEGITTILTSLIASFGDYREQTPVSVSTLADTWINLTYNIQGGERNRALSIVKARGTSHSNHVCELVLSAKGPDLTDVYAENGEVLMGAARLERERAIAHADEKARTLHVTRERELVAEITAAEERVHILQREIAARRSALAELKAQARAQHEEQKVRRAAIGRARYADRDRSPKPPGTSASSRRHGNSH
ncbi:MAG: hypothetical protein JWO52_7491 [Gammaproteobacteria bacterium]|nr:hypothetical protein [Gammaproteobacteria bacterium]